MSKTKPAVHGLSDGLRKLKVGQKKKFVSSSANTARVTTARILGAGNYTVHVVGTTLDDLTEVEITRLA